MYYSHNKLFGFPGFKDIMTQNKLVLLEKFMHFADLITIDSNCGKTVNIDAINQNIAYRARDKWWKVICRGHPNAKIRKCLISSK